MDIEPQIMITYSAKELLERIEAKVDTGFKNVDLRLDSQDRRITAIELERNGSKAHREGLRNVVLAICTVLSSVGAAIGAVGVLH